uniref:diaminopimelate epimerase n=1 Tax=Steinernema glaseri TaxID=37863 RepID=A0A1I7YEE0_9BILA
MHGAGNDFVMLDGVTQHIELTPERARALADRHFGIGADQILLVEAATEAGADFRYRIFNADGSEVEHCGNGARCFVRFVHEQGLSSANPLRAQIRTGIISLNDDPQRGVDVMMGTTRFAPADVGFDNKGLETRAQGEDTLWLLPVPDQAAPVALSLVSISNPHAVQVVDDVKQAPVATMLAESDPAALPELICSSLERIFEMPVVRLHCWNPDEVLADDALVSWAYTLINPYCGVRREQEFLADLQQDAQSVAIVPLKFPESNTLFGLLVLGSPEATRFTADMAAPQALSPAMQSWLHQLSHEKRYSEHTLSAYRNDLRHLLAQYPGTDPDTLTQSQLRQAAARLHAQGLAPRSLARILAAWRGYYQSRTKELGWPLNPAASLKAPKIGRPLPKALSVDQTQQLLDRPTAPIQDDPVSWRNQAMFELFYSSGLRLAELVSLDTHYHQDTQYQSKSWLLLDDRELVVSGKGGKTRRLPVGEKALHALQRWLEKRPALASLATSADASAALFLGARGAR